LNARKLDLYLIFLSSSINSEFFYEKITWIKSTKWKKTLETIILCNLLYQLFIYLSSRGAFKSSNEQPMRVYFKNWIKVTLVFMSYKSSQKRKSEQIKKKPKVVRTHRRNNNSKEVRINEKQDRYHTGFFWHFVSESWKKRVARHYSKDVFKKNP
jgi:DNA integrity scanning protein DisA with diadenylate cyclase activity